ncbi:MAG: glycoside hydrolase family 18 protein [Deltaproteobacteria bacterium]|nr:glycoside hydrolase family 18 protein [Deltaproteobacteria bacterium]
MLRLHVLGLILLASVIGCASNDGTDKEWEGDSPGECADDIDNDMDQLFDCNDPDCANSPACGGTDGSTDTSSQANDSSSSETQSSDSVNDTGTGVEPMGEGEYWVTGYYVGYQRSLYPPEVVNYQAMTHLAIGAILPKSDGTLDTNFYLTAMQGAAMVDELVERAHAVGTKVLGMVGGAGADAEFASASSSVNLSKFVQELVSFARDSHHMDGLDLDWEPLNDEDHAPFEALVDALRAAWPEVILTLPTGFLNSNYGSPDPFLAQIAPKLDQINLMSYGMAGGWSGWESWHSSALYGDGPSYPTSVSQSAESLIAANIPSKKVGVGIGFYGLCYSEPVTGPRQALNGASVLKRDNKMSYTNIMTDYYSESSYVFDTEAKVPYLSLTPAKDSCSYVTYENEATIEAKASYVKQKNLGGVIIWTINQGYLPNASGAKDPLMDTLFTSLRQ